MWLHQRTWADLEIGSVFCDDVGEPWQVIDRKAGWTRARRWDGQITAIPDRAPEHPVRIFWLDNDEIAHLAGEEFGDERMVDAIVSGRHLHESESDFCHEIRQIHAEQGRAAAVEHHRAQRVASLIASLRYYGRLPIRAARRWSEIPDDPMELIAHINLEHNHALPDSTVRGRRGKDRQDRIQGLRELHEVLHSDPNYPMNFPHHH